MNANKHDTVRAIEWRNDRLYLLDQRLLPDTCKELEYTDIARVATAITDMVVRGAPAIGITAAFAVVIAARARYQQSTTDWKELLEDDLSMLAASRPTAINLTWAIERMRGLINAIDGDPVSILLDEAKRIHNEDVAANYRMGKLALGLFQDHSSVLTHCNAGSLATGGYGTALGVIRACWTAGKLDSVYADETRPWLQGSRLTAWELLQDQIPVTLIAEGAASMLMQQGMISWIIVGSDRIAVNGDVANKIGTYNLAVSARHHGVKFMVVAPTSTIAMQTPTGKDIPIEFRGADELLSLAGQPVAASGAQAWNPVFDVTPASLVDVIVTEKGLIQAPDEAKIRALMGA